jgi:hypothetical protein
MDDSELHCHLSDSEMLDDAAGDTYSSPLQVATHVFDEEAMSKQVHCTEPVAAIDDPATYPLSDALDGTHDDQNQPASPCVMSLSHRDRASQLNDLKTGVGSGSDVLARIESIFEAMLDVLLNERGQLSIAIITRPSSRRQQLNSTIANTDSVQHMCFPGRTEKEAWRFGQYGLKVCRRGADIAQLL